MYVKFKPNLVFIGYVTIVSIHNEIQYCGVCFCLNFCFICNPLLCENINNNVISGFIRDFMG